MTMIANWCVLKVFIDEGSSIDVLFYHTFKKLDVSSHLIQPYPKLLHEFVVERVHTKGYIDLLKTFATFEAY